MLHYREVVSSHLSLVKIRCTKTFVYSLRVGGFCKQIKRKVICFVFSAKKNLPINQLPLSRKCGQEKTATVG